MQFSIQKEVHFFDRTTEYRKGIPGYLKRFRPIAERSANASFPIFAEATPFYIASENACRRIAKMIPSVRLLVVLRDPVARAHSEYHMKKRYPGIASMYSLLLLIMVLQASRSAEQLP